MSTPSREEQLKVAEVLAEESNQLYREFIEWKRKSTTFAKDILFYWGMTQKQKEKASTPDKILAALKKISDGPTNLLAEFKYQDEQKESAEKTYQERLNREQKEQEELKLQEEAVIYLQEHGLKLGKDFTLNNVVLTADNFAFTQEVNKVSGVEFIPFIGNDTCEETCQGWDGLSHRCDCGNRRVEWCSDFYSHSFKTPSIIAIAY